MGVNFSSLSVEMEHMVTARQLLDSMGSLIALPKPGTSELGGTSSPLNPLQQNRKNKKKVKDDFSGWAQDDRSANSAGTAQSAAVP